MANEMDTFVYMMAAEKMVSMISMIDQTMEFMEEYKVKPDEEVKKALKPLIEQMKKWIENNVT
jgi:molecular chaperone DnaK (HSP70)